ncbi:hypothetical protein FN846DRAFT_979569 [Sphaerosporella brunnea]|uniref:CCCH zinc finger and SMR domain-containing protein n=1 Tax=Sphaerosporella brunnea TaxID=1250544 RepID=A0A5J5EF29_9PEZI|nr:hypothetical protein FN846DRAFT_979569 [Sphaerosporella brunnea]
MISDELFAECLVILQDDSILDEDQAERISALISSKTDLEGSVLEGEVLDVLWRHRTKTSPASSPPVRHNHTIIRRASPAPWQFPRVGTPTPSLSGTPPLQAGFPPSLRSSPFPSPRPSPRLAYSSPLIPHSPTLNNYEPILHQDVTSAPAEAYGDFGNDTVQWLIGDDSSFMYGAAPTQNMTPHDMLRSVLGEGRTDEQIDQALEICSYDLGATLAMLMEQQQQHQQNNIHLYTPTEHATIIGKSTTPNPERARPITPRNGVVCRFFLSTGQCLRADCRFSHDLGTTICKYWLMGSCLAGDTCIFSHDPTMSVSKMTLGSDSRTSTPPPQLSYQDASAFPTLAPDQWSGNGNLGPPPGFKFTPSRPNSRQQYRERNNNNNNEHTVSSLVPPVDDSEAFPSLGSSTARPNKKRDRRAGGGKNDIPTGPSSLAEVVRMGSPGPNSSRWTGSPNSKRSTPAISRASAAHIPPPQQIPWLETGSALNRTYLKHRKEALNHGVLRAKYLQMASAAWQRNDAKAAKEHSRKANNENLAMVKAHKEASKAIYEERNKAATQQGAVELFVDLHGLLPDEAIKYLEEILVAHQASSQPLYAIVGTSHHSKGGKDKLSRAVRTFLDEWKYAYREFSGSGDRNGGILGIDPSSFDKSLLPSSADAAAAVEGSENGKKEGRKK